MLHRLNGLSGLSNEEICSRVATISSKVTVLALVGNNLGARSSIELVAIFKAIPETVHSLRLGINGFDNLNTRDLAQALASIPVTISSLDLGANFFGKKTGDELAEIFRSIPGNVTSLDLKASSFIKKIGAPSSVALESIPSHVTELNLSANQLDKLNLDTLNELKGALPHIKTVHLSHQELLEIKRAKPSKIFILRAMFPKVQNFILEGSFLNEADQFVELKDINPIEKDIICGAVPSLKNLSAFFIMKDMKNRKMPPCEVNRLPITRADKELISAMMPYA